ncbi:hypothetical protein HDU98_003423 [Podochytrium sp. JEL0797]|nr:hypothetical protein HDU98_003423 [Podochytrium sp. JEL0797]
MSSDHPGDHLGLGMRLYRLGQYREALNSLKKAYQTPLHDGVAAWAQWTTLTLISDIIIYHTFDESDDIFLKTIQKDENAPTVHRGLSASVRAMGKRNQGDHEASAVLLHKCISICARVTEEELGSQILVGTDARTKMPRYSTLREYLAQPDSFLTLAKAGFMGRSEALEKLKVDSNGNEMATSLVNMKLMWGEDVSMDRRLSDTVMFEERVLGRLEGQKCDECGALARAENGEVVTRLRKCQKCLSKFYCSPECQRAAWKSGHKISCRAPGDLVRFDFVRVHGLQNAVKMNGQVFEVQRLKSGSAADEEVKWIVSLVGGGGEVAVKEKNLTRVMCKEERWNWTALDI